MNHPSLTGNFRRAALPAASAFLLAWCLIPGRERPAFPLGKPAQTTAGITSKGQAKPSAGKRPPAAASPALTSAGNPTPASRPVPPTPLPPLIGENRTDPASAQALLHPPAENPAGAADPETSAPGPAPVPSPDETMDFLPQRPDPRSGGVLLTVGRQLVQVEAFARQPAASAPALQVAITPLPEDSAAPAARRPSRPASHGLTHEEELFRTKWGWAAYDAVRRAAMETASAPDSN